MRILTLTLLLTTTFQFLTAQPEAIFKVHFDTDISALSTQAEDVILEQTTEITAPSDYRVQLIGHTDRRGSWEYNQALSERRAASVKQRLVTLGFSPDNISWKGLSYDDPVDKKDTDAAWTKNRRVDVIIEKSNWNVPADYHSIESSAVSVINYERSGTKIEIPADAFMHKNGNPVEGDVLIYYREFRDFADFMASDLPMNFNRDGEDFYFNSTGMFEIRAYQDAEELVLRSDKNIGLDFVQTQVLEETQFWRFDEATQSWESGTSSIVTQNGRWENTPVDTLRKVACQMQLGIKQLSLKKLKSFIPLTLAMIDSAAKYDDRYIPQLDGNRYRDRFNSRDKRGRYAGMHYVGHLSRAQVKTNPKYYNIELLEVDGKDEAKLFQIKDLANQNPELALFKDALWEFKRVNSPNNKKEDFTLEDKKWSDIRIYRGKKRKAGKRVKFNRHKPFRIKLKEGGSFVEIEANLHALEGEEISKRQATLTYQNYTDALRDRERDFDETIEANMIAAAGFWNYLKVLMPRHFPLPFALTDPLNKDCDCFTNVKEKQGYPCYRFLLDNIVYLEQHFKDLQAQQLSDQALSRYVTSFDGKITTDKVLYKPIYQEFSEDVPRLNLSAMGVFNLDVLKRFKDQEQIFASFENIHGENIPFKKIDVINYDLNGLLSFNEPSIYLDLGAPTTIVVYGTNDKLYTINPDELAALDLKNRRAFTFKVNELQDGVNDPQELRETLAYN